MMTRSPLFGFSYSDEQWSQIEQSLRYLRPDGSDLENACQRLHWAGAEYASAVKNGPTSEQEREKRRGTWIKIGRLGKELQALLSPEHVEQRFQVPQLKGLPLPDQKPYGDVLAALIKINAEADYLVRHYRPMTEDGYPRVTPKAKFQSDVLDVWTSLGGELKFSRHPVAKKVRGPLARYFSAAAHPLVGGSLETLPDILKSHGLRVAALQKWSAKAPER
jgi:hypothetical protein